MFQSLAHVVRRMLHSLRVTAFVLACVAPAGLSVLSQGAQTVPASAGTGDVQRLFESANEKFRAALELLKTDRPAAEAKFREAAGAWREVARLGSIHNVKLESNIANASLFAGDVSGAILAYRRALAIDPTDRDVLAGLAAARRSAGTEALALGQNLAKKDDGGRAGGLRGTLEAIVEVLEGATDRMSNLVSSRALLWSAVVFYVAFFACATLRILGIIRVNGAVLALLIAGMCLASGPLVVRELRNAKTVEAVVLASNIVARNGPAELYDAAFQEPLRAGLEVAVQEQRGAWSKIRLRDGRAAWVRTDALEVI